MSTSKPGNAITRELERAVGHSLAIKRVPIDSLHQDPANARSHGERNLDAIRGSLARFGQAEPLVIHKKTGRVIGGNGRLVAMKALGWTEVDVVELDISDLEATALGIALNRTAELAEWDQSALAQILASLRTEDALDGLGFDESEINELVANLEGEVSGPLDDPGPDDPPQEPVSRTGDLWKHPTVPRRARTYGSASAVLFPKCSDPELRQPWGAESADRSGLHLQLLPDHF